MLPVSCILKSDIEVRPFRLEDIERVLAIERHSFGRDAWPKKLFLQHFRESPELFLIAKSGRRIVGYVITSAETRNAELLSIAVDSRDRRSGIGQDLLDATRARLRARAIRSWWLMVDVRNEPAIRFYEKNGFTRTRTVKDYYGRGRDAWRMRLKATTTDQ